MTTKAFIDINIDGRLKVTTPYNSDFVDDLKNEIPSQYREWVQIIKAWLVDPHYQPDLEALCKKHFDEVLIDTTTQNFGIFTSNEVEEVYAILYLIPNAPMWLVSKVWKLLALEYHPDRNSGGVEKMKKVNQAYQRIKEENQS
jgi:hypothetical protein